MADLNGATIAATYSSLLKFDDNGVVEADTVQVISDGRGTDTSLSLSTQRATFTLGSGAADDFIVDGTTLVVEGDNNRVGIRTATPASLLDVSDAGGGTYGTATAIIRNTDNADLVGLGLYSLEQKWDLCSIVSGGTDYFGIRDATAGTTPLAIVEATGNVGIGTITPDSKLQVAGGGKFGATNDGETWNDHLVVLTNSTTTNRGGILLCNNETIGASHSSIKISSSVSGGAETANFAIGNVTNNATDTINKPFVSGVGATGFVGIGTLSPAHTLDCVTPAAGSAVAKYVGQFTHTSTTDANCLGLHIDFSAADPNDGTQPFIRCEDSASARFVVYSNGELWQAAGGTTIDSDRNLKDNIVDATAKLDDINKLKVRNFTMKDDKGNRKRLGFIAQELEEIFPSLVSDHTRVEEERDDDGVIVQEAQVNKTLQMGAFVPMLVKAVQELSAKVTVLENA